MSNDLFLKEIDLLNKLYYKSKNQFKSSLLLHKMDELRRYSKKFNSDKSGYNKERVKLACKRLFIIASNYFVMGHFAKLCALLFGISSRIYFSIDYCSKHEDEIDDIFGDIVMS